MNCTMSYQGSHRDWKTLENKDDDGKVMACEKLVKKIMEFCNQSWNVTNLLLNFANFELF